MYGEIPANKEAFESDLLQAANKLAQVREEIGKVIVGQGHLVDSLLIGIIADGHLLLEGVPGIAKTLAVTTLAKVISADFKRIQFTPDLLPADLTGISIYNPKEGNFSIKKGPIFTNIVLADEINRAPPKVQSALLEVMGEKQVTVGGETFEVGRPFMVLATQNPLEQEGTYPLPEAQTDRFFMKVKIDYPDWNEEKQIVQRMARLDKRVDVKPMLSCPDIMGLRRLVDSIYMDDKLVNYILDIIFATRSPEKKKIPIVGFLEYGASPRATICLIIASKAHALLHGRGFVTPHDIKQIALNVLRHRLPLSYEAQAQQLNSEDIIERIFGGIHAP